MVSADQPSAGQWGWCPADGVRGVAVSGRWGHPRPPGGLGTRGVKYYSEGTHVDEPCSHSSCWNINALGFFLI